MRVRCARVKIMYEKCAEGRKFETSEPSKVETVKPKTRFSLPLRRFLP